MECGMANSAMFGSPFRLRIPRAAFFRTHHVVGDSGFAQRMEFSSCFSVDRPFTIQSASPLRGGGGGGRQKSPPPRQRLMW